jgi:ribosomal RNA-processing protein 17
VAQLREQRKQDLDSHVEAVNAIIKKQQDGGSEDGEEDDEEVEWGGVSGDEGPELTKSTIPMEEGQEDEYVDEDRYTTVTVEPMSVHDNDDTTKGDGEEEGEKPAEDAPEDDGKKKKRIWTKEKPPSDKKKKPKTKKFRYESKADRKTIRTKQSLKNKAQARARKGE